MFHYSFSAPLQAVTEIIENKDATILVLSAWQWAVGGRGRKHRAAGPGRTHPLGTSPQLQPPCGASRAPSATARLPPWAAGLRGHGALQLLLIPFAQEAARPGGQHRPQPTGTGVGKAHPNAGLPHKGSCRGAAPGPRAARALAPPCRAGSPQLGALPAEGLQPPVLTARMGRVLLLEGAGGGRTARPVPPLCASQAAEGPARAAHSRAETGCTAFMQVMSFNGAKPENPPQVTQALVLSHLTQLFALLQLLLQLKRPAKEGERKRFFFFLSYDQALNSAGRVEKEINRTTKYKASQGVGERLEQRTTLPCLAVRGEPEQGKGVPWWSQHRPVLWVSPRC